MQHPVSPFRLVFLTRGSENVPDLAERISECLGDIGVPDYILVHHDSRVSAPYPHAIHVAFRQYPVAHIVHVLDENEALENGEDLEYFQQQASDEDDLRYMVEDRLMALLTEDVEADDMESSSPEQFDELVSEGLWVVTKIGRYGIYDDSTLTDSEIIQALRRHS